MRSGLACDGDLVWEAGEKLHLVSTGTGSAQGSPDDKGGASARGGQRFHQAACGSRDEIADTHGSAGNDSLRVLIEAEEVQRERIAQISRGIRGGCLVGDHTERQVSDPGKGNVGGIAPGFADEIALGEGSIPETRGATFGSDIDQRPVGEEFHSEPLAQGREDERGCKQQRDETDEDEQWVHGVVLFGVFWLLPAAGSD